MKFNPDETLPIPEHPSGPRLAHATDRQLINELKDRQLLVTVYGEKTVPNVSMIRDMHSLVDHVTLHLAKDIAQFLRSTKRAFKFDLLEPDRRSPTYHPDTVDIRGELTVLTLTTSTQTPRVH